MEIGKQDEQNLAKLTVRYAELLAAFKEFASHADRIGKAGEKNPFVGVKVEHPKDNRFVVSACGKRIEFLFDIQAGEHAHHGVARVSELDENIPPGRTAVTDFAFRPNGDVIRPAPGEADAESIRKEQGAYVALLYGLRAALKW